MNKYFKGLSEEEYKVLVDAPVKISVLIAGADSIIDEKEVNWAEKVTEFRTQTEDVELREYYRDVNEGFSEKLFSEIERLKQLGDSVKERNFKLSEELMLVNELWEKINKDLAIKLYNSFKTLAIHIARSSGGVIGFGAISPEEKLWIDLKMIKNPEEE
jgi:hypothetical protein